MNEISTSSHLNESHNPLKEKFNGTENVWIIPEKYFFEYNLSPTQALILTLIRQTSKKKGFSEISYSYIRKFTKQKSDHSIKNDIDLLVEQKRVYRHSYMSRKGRRSKLVYPDTAGKYWSYLTACKQFKERKKFEDEFMVNLVTQGNPDDTPPSIEKVSPPAPNHTNLKEKVANAKNADAANAKNADAINTTYLLNNTNNETCKGSDEPTPAVSFENSIRKELRYSFSPTETEIGVEWYRLQTESKKEKMKNPIACIINALQEGYAHSEVEASRVQSQQEYEKKLLEKKQIEKNKYEREMNVKLAHQLVKKFSHFKGWKHEIYENGMSIINENVEKGQDWEGGSRLNYYILPCGTRKYGKTHFIKIYFDIPSSEFKNSIKDFLREAQWITHVEQKTAG